MEADRATRLMILARIPQKKPFRFIDEILALSDSHVLGAYRFRRNEYFYRGHFPGRPITPGVILVETMAQSGVVALGIYLSHLDRGVREGGETLTLFTSAEVIEFSGLVLPGERVIVKGEKIYFRRRALKAKVTMTRENGETVCSGILAGMEVELT